MKITVLLSAALILAVPAFPAVISFTATLSSANEVPVNASTGTGTATVVFDNILHSLNVDVTFSGLTGLTTASHIHCCADPGTNAGVATELPSFSNLPLGVTSGSFTQTYVTNVLATYNPAFVTANGGTADSAEAALFAGMLAGKSYLNVHSSFAKGGEIRANFTPEPGTFGLIAIPTIALMFLLRRSTRNAALR